MTNLKKHGKGPFTVVAIHGGPGAAGAVEPFAAELARDFGVLEPLQRAHSVAGQIEELAEVIRKNTDGPAVLIGHSWGAWLAGLAAAEHPDLVSKIILVSSGVFETRYVDGMMATRMERLTQTEQQLVNQSLEKLQADNANSEEKHSALSQLGQLMEKADAFCLLDDPGEKSPVICDGEIYNSVWPQAAEMRESGELIERFTKITCPVIAIHGLHDPSPADGVKLPLEKCLKDFRFIALDKCGHNPWEEKFARDKFFDIMRKLLK